MGTNLRSIVGTFGRTSNALRPAAATNLDWSRNVGSAVGIRCDEENRIWLARPVSEDRQGRTTILIVLADPNPSGIPGSDIYQPLPHW